MNRRIGIVAMVTLSPFLLCGSTAPQGCQPQPQPSHTGAEAAGIAIAAGAVIGTVVLVEVHKSHHAIKGCVSTGSNGLDVRDEKDMKTYNLVGVTANTTVGDRVQLHGSKEKSGKDGAADPTFVVEKMSRDYGPCKVIPQTPGK
jgi:hypothetical protein